MFEMIVFDNDGLAWTRTIVNSVADARRRILKLNKKFSSKYSGKLLSVDSSKRVKCVIDWDGQVIGEKR